jgi:glycyl-tRNA synthetase
LQQEIKGPPADRAFDAHGKPTRVAEGFARSKGVQVSDLVIKTLDGGDYVVAQVEEKGSPAWRVISEALPGWIAAIRFNKSMRWNESGVAFSRPIRWLLALHGDQVVPFSYAGYSSGRETHGLRFESNETMKVESSQDYLDKMKQQGIILDPTARRMAIKEQAEALAESLGGRIPQDDDLLVEIANLVEKPTAFLGHFDEKYLEILPSEVLVSVMKKHQRYFVLEDTEGDLLPYFIGVRNGGEGHLDIVADGNEQVILARFDDAAFFVKKDKQKPLEEFVDELDTLVFQEKLGSFLDKSKRIEKLIRSLADWFALTREEVALTQRAARLSKADLATNMVVEMTSLQGVMGKYYALHSGEDPIVAEAIFEHYLPRSANDHYPSTKPGLLVGLADRLDSIVGLFAVGLAPTGTKDPFAQRRAALGICQNLIKWQQNFDIDWALRAAADGLDVEVTQETLLECKEFILGRLRVMLLDMGFNYDVVDAVLAEQGHDPFGAFLGVKALSSWVNCAAWSEILPAYSRCVRITRDQAQKYSVNESLFETESERSLFQAVLQAEMKMSGERSVDSFIEAFKPLIPEINRFFDEVMVMVEEDAVRENRLGLLQGVAGLTEGIVDMSCLEGF